MKLEQLLEKCPKCGSQNKTVQRKMLDDQLAQAKMKAVVCDGCGHIFKTKEDKK